MSKYKVGDRVLIKSFSEVCDSHGWNSKDIEAMLIRTNQLRRDNWAFFCKKYVTIKHIDNDNKTFEINENSNLWYFKEINELVIKLNLL